METKEWRETETKEHIKHKNKHNPDKSVQKFGVSNKKIKNKQKKVPIKYPLLKKKYTEI